MNDILPATRASFTTSDGVRLEYRVGGQPEGRPLLFCYGLLCSSFHFKYQWEHLARTHRLLLVDYRGHHTSQAPQAFTTLNFARLAQDLVEFLEHVGESRAVTVVGHSMGVNLALELYERASERVEALVLISGAATFPAKHRAELKRLLFLNSLMKLVDGVAPRLAEAFWRRQAWAPGAEQVAGLVGFNPKLSSREDIRGVIELMSGFSPRVFAQLLGEYLCHDRRDTLARIEIPTLIVSGTCDRMVPPRFHDELHGRIRDSRLVRIEEGSHCPQFDRPAEVNAALDAFLSETCRFAC